jgi:hypothetical protein
VPHVDLAFPAAVGLTAVGLERHAVDTLAVGRRDVGPDEVAEIAFRDRVDDADLDTLARLVVLAEELNDVAASLDGLRIGRKGPCASA